MLILKDKRTGKIGSGDRQDKNIWLRPLILLIIIGGLTFLFYETGLIHYFLNRESLSKFLNSLGPFSFMVFILLQAAQVIVAPIPGEATGLIGGYLYGPMLGLILSTIGLTIGSWAAFALTKIFGRPFAERFISRETFGRFDYLLHHKGAFLVFLLFLIPGLPKDSLCYILGLGHLSTKEFLIISGIGRLFGTILLTLGGNYIRLQQYLRFSVLVGAAVILIFIALAYRDKLERFFRILHIKSRRKKRS